MSAKKAVYGSITMYTVEAKCSEPLHIGNADGNRERILTDPDSGAAFIQASSLAGICSDYYKNVSSEQERNRLFGDRLAKNGVEGKSRIVFSDGIFKQKTVKLESRTRIQINGETGSGEQKEVAGTDIYSGKKKSSGQLHRVTYIMDGAVFRFTVLCMDEGADCVEACLSAMEHGKIVLGGQTTIGCGRITLNRVKKQVFCMSKEKERSDWIHTNLLDLDGNLNRGEDITSKIKTKIQITDTDYVLSFKAEVDSALLIKAETIKKGKVEKGLKAEKDRMPDAMNMTRNEDDKYMIPGSSLKGVFRSRMESIARYLSVPPEKTDEIFANRSKIRFENAVIENQIAGGGEQVADIYRTHLNKISGGVKYQALFSELVTAGTANVQIRVSSKKRKTDQVPIEAILGLLLYAVRDLSAGMMNIGSGASIGRGFVHIGKVTIAQGEKKMAEFSLADGSVKDLFVVSCLKALQEVAE